MASVVETCSRGGQRGSNGIGGRRGVRGWSGESRQWAAGQWYCFGGVGGRDAWVIIFVAVGIDDILGSFFGSVVVVGGVIGRVAVVGGGVGSFGSGGFGAGWKSK